MEEHELREAFEIDIHYAPYFLEKRPDFYIGYHDGAVKADSDDSKDTLGYRGCRCEIAIALKRNLMDCTCGYHLACFKSNNTSIR